MAFITKHINLILLITTITITMSITVLILKVIQSAGPHATRSALHQPIEPVDPPPSPVMAAVTRSHYEEVERAWLKRVWVPVSSRGGSVSSVAALRPFVV